MSRIDDKYNDLKSHGLDLGAPQAAEEDAGSGGRVRRYANGNIYYHPNTGAHEVHGGILGLYLGQGGPGANPATGRRDLGYPISDELVERPPRSLFEWGAIYWTGGTGGVVLSGSIWETYKAHSELGLPVAGNAPVAGGTAAYFERGVLFSSNGAPNVTRVLIGLLQPPLMGRPYLLDPDEGESRRFRNLCAWKGLARSEYNALVAWRPSVFTDIWKERLSLSPVGKPNYRVPLIPIQVSTTSEAPQFLDMVTVLEAFPNGPTDIADRTLYDLRLALPNGSFYAVSPHCIYARKDWTSFGLLHITDLHVCGRNDGFRAKLAQKGLADASRDYANFQDNFRDFVKYANRLHAKGLADAVVATGDLIDYVEEDGEEADASNFARLRRLILGEPMDPGSVVGEALRIPIYVTFGNHDYRIAPYDLRAKIDVPIVDTVQLKEYSSHNLIESDAIALQDGNVPSYGLTSLDGALRMAQWDRFDNKYNYFKKYFTPNRSYVVNLGQHRLVVMDTKYDEGVPAEANLDLLIKYITGSISPATKKFLGGGAPDSSGFTRDEMNMLARAIGEAGDAGLVIVGMHCPALSPKGGEYPYYMRETIHPTADPALTDQYVSRNELGGGSWPRTGTAFFKTGDNKDGMDKGVIAHNANEFMQMCAGVGQPRPVDLVLWGHHHDRVEYRLRWAGQLEMYMDFYTDNPRSYYPTVNGADRQDLKKGDDIQIQVVPGAPLPVGVAVTRDHRGDGPTITYGRARVPPYADPLNDSADPRAWWRAHRPILAQTSALGPIDPRQRFGTFWEIHGPLGLDVGPVESDRAPDVPRGVSLEALPGPTPQPTFQGFRLLQVENNVIARMRYVVLHELRENNFRMPWEPRTRFDDVLDEVVIAGGGFHTVEVQPEPPPPANPVPPTRRPGRPGNGRPTVRDHRR